MATLYITEFSKPAFTGQSIIPAGALQNVVAEQAISISGSSSASAAFNSATKFVRIHTDAICSIEYADSGTPVATTSTMRLPADTVEYFGVNPGGKIAVITNT